MGSCWRSASQGKPSKMAEEALSAGDIDNIFDHFANGSSALNKYHLECLLDKMKARTTVAKDNDKRLANAMDIWTDKKSKSIDKAMFVSHMNKTISKHPDWVARLK